MTLCQGSSLASWNRRRTADCSPRASRPPIAIMSSRPPEITAIAMGRQEPENIGLSGCRDRHQEPAFQTASEMVIFFGRMPSAWKVLAMSCRRRKRGTRPAQRHFSAGAADEEASASRSNHPASQAYGKSCRDPIGWIRLSSNQSAEQKRRSSLVHGAASRAEHALLRCCCVSRARARTGSRVFYIAGSINVARIAPESSNASSQTGAVSRVW